MSAPVARVPTGALGCATCHVTFTDQEQRKDHYATEWHRHNLKRKVAGLPSVTEIEYNNRLSSLKRATVEPAAGAGDFVASCTICGKNFSTEKAHQHHLRSKMHIEKAAKASSSASAPQDEQRDVDMNAGLKTNERHAVARNSEMSFEEFMEWKLRTAPRLSLNDCLFCRNTEADMESNLQHMRTVHSFYVPYIEHVEDMKGLLTYLGEKVSIGNICLYCNEKGKSFHSMESVRQHMIEKSHCRILFEDHEDEYEDFYDYELEYETGSEDDSDEDDDGKIEEGDDEEEWEDVSPEEAAKYAEKLARGEEVVIEGGDDDDEDMADARKSGGGGERKEKKRVLKKRPFQARVQFGRDASGDAYEVIIPNGDGTQKVLGHRQLRRYYKQQPAPVDEREEKIRLLIMDYQAQGLVTRHQSANGALALFQQQKPIGNKTQLKIEKDRTHMRGKKNMQQGMRHNMLFSCWTDMNTIG